MAALSVQYKKSGQQKRTPFFLAFFASISRSAAFADTPTASTSVAIAARTACGELRAALGAYARSLADGQKGTGNGITTTVRFSVG